MVLNDVSALWNVLDEEIAKTGLDTWSQAPELRSIISVPDGSLSCMLNFISHPQINIEAANAPVVQPQPTPCVLLSKST